MKIVVVSDTHGFHSKLTVPEGDVLVSCGDWSRVHGHHLDSSEFARWMGEHPHPCKIAVAGNHEHWVEQNLSQARDLFAANGVHLLTNMPVFAEPMIEHQGVRFAGASWCPERQGPGARWAFQRSEADRDELWNDVPSVEVLVTHVPPKAVLDMTSQGHLLGCPALERHVFGRIRPQLHLFGHVHGSRGQTTINNIDFVNASVSTRWSYEQPDEDGMVVASVGIRQPLVITREFHGCGARDSEKVNHA